MNKFLPLLLTATILVGCSTIPQEHVVYQTTLVSVVPTLVVPQRPVLYVDQLTQADKANPGIVAQYYRASIVQLNDYSKELEKAIQAYQDAAKDKKTLQQLEDELNDTKAQTATLKAKTP